MTSPQRTSKFQRFLQLESEDKCVLLSAVGRLFVARVQLAITPFDQLAYKLSSETNGDGEVADPDWLQRVSFAIRAAANNVPWRSDCFPQAIAARAMLKSRGYASTIHLGVEKAGEGELAAHAWLTCGETVVTGEEEADRYVEIHRLGE